MATVAEAFFDRNEVIGDSADVPYIVFDAVDEDDVKAAAAAEIPSELGTLRRKSIEIGERVNETTWKVVARYEAPPVSNPWGPTPDSTFTFDVGSETQHITQSIETVGRYGPAASTKLGGAIGYDGENVAGVDIRVPAPTFTETHFFSDEEFTEAYRNLLIRKAFHYNTDTFRGFDPGEVLFLGATCSRRGDDWDDPWEVTFKFAVSLNRTDLTVGDITGIDKKGWEYMWVQYADDLDDTVKEIVKKPVAVYVEKVYYGATFADLGI